MNDERLQALADLKELEKLNELEELMARMSDYSSDWRNRLDERERRLVSNCVSYAHDDPAGLPGHNLMIIIAKLAGMLDEEALVEDKA